MTTKIILESPFANENKKKFNDNYLYLCTSARKMMIDDDNAPLFFHALYTQFLHDDIQEERNLGLFKSFHYHTSADNKTYAIDRGISKGMILGAEDAIEKNMEIKFYTVLPTTHIIHQKIEEINKIKDNKLRWIAGNKLVDKLLNNPSHKKSFEDSGDLTKYSKYVKDDIENVKKCILDFFAPIVDNIREELSISKTNTKKNNKSGKKTSWSAQI